MNRRKDYEAIKNEACIGCDVNNQHDIGWGSGDIYENIMLTEAVVKKEELAS